MKKPSLFSVISIAALMCSPLMAQRDIFEKVETKLFKLQSKTRRLENRIYSMNRSELRETNCKLKKVLAIMNGNDDRAIECGNSRPTRRTLTVTGSIESHTFNFKAVDTMDLTKQCMAKFNFSSVDDITVSVDFKPMRSHRNSSSYWKSDAAVCSILAKFANQQGLPNYVNNGRNLQIVGDIEFSSFSFEGRTKNDLFDQCTSFFTSRITSSVDDIFIYNGNKRTTKRNSTAYWNSGAEVCGIIVNNI